MTEYSVRGQQDKKGYFLTFAGFPSVRKDVATKEEADAVARQKLAELTGEDPDNVAFEVVWDFEGLAPH